MEAQNSRAKILINAFEKQIEVANKALEQNRFKTAEAKIGSLQRSLESIKKKDPTYDTSQLQKKLEDLKKRCGANKEETLKTRANDKEQYYVKVDANNKMTEYVRSSYLSKENAEELSKIDVSQLKMEVHRKNMVSYTETALERSGDDYKGVIDRFRVKVGNSYSGEAEKAYEDFLNKKRYYDYAVKFFPGEKVLEKVQRKFQSLFDELGGLENVKKTAKENAIKELATVRVPAAAIKDSKIENLFKIAFNNESKDTNWNRTLLKVNITDRSWTIIKNKYTGTILGRKHFAAIAFKDNKKNECRLYISYHIYQQYNGNGYNDFATGKSNMASQGILCENINN